MKYAALIYGDETTEITPEQQTEMMNAYFEFGAKNEKSLIPGGEALQPTATATTIRVREGKLSTTDGPFAETKEQLGGFYLIEADDLDGAIEVAAQIPGAQHGSVEVRPVMDFSAYQPE